MKSDVVSTDGSVELARLLVDDPVDVVHLAALGKEVNQALLLNLS